MNAFQNSTPTSFSQNEIRTLFSELPEFLECGYGTVVHNQVCFCLPGTSENIFGWYSAGILLAYVGWRSVMLLNLPNYTDSHSQQGNILPQTSLVLRLRNLIQQNLVWNSNFGDMYLISGPILNYICIPMSSMSGKTRCSKNVEGNE